MNFLLLYVDEGVQFDENEVLQILNDIPGVYDLQKGEFIGAVLKCNYDFNEDSTIVRLSPDLETISISGTGDAGLQIALEIQKKYPATLHLIDSDYQFDLPLTEIDSVRHLRAEISAFTSTGDVDGQ